MARVDAAASSIAGMSAIDPVEPAAATQPAVAEPGVAIRLTSPARTPGDIEDALVEMMAAGLTYRANAAAVDGADRMIGALLDIKA